VPQDVLQKIKDGTANIVLLEGLKATDKPLRLKIVNRSNKKRSYNMASEIPLKLSDVRDMIRVKNLRPVGVVPMPEKETRSDWTDEPQNNPDAKSNGKNVVFIHGFNESPAKAMGNICEVFKRLYWTGSKAKFTGVEWRGDMGSTHFHASVTNAFLTAPGFAQHLLTLQGEVNVIAFSLGNMVVSSAIQEHGAYPANFFMLHAAVAKEAYDATDLTDDMIQAEWRPYTNRLYASKWHELFPEGDGRHDLTWKGRFANVVGPQVYNFFSTGEDVLRNYGPDVSITRELIDQILHWDFGQYAWAVQELWKGRAPDGVGGSRYGGWGFKNSTVNTDYYNRIDESEGGHHYDIYLPNQAANIPSEALKAIPFFNMNNPVPSLLAEPDNPSGAGSQFASANKNKLLAEMIPALSFATGRNEVALLNRQGNGTQNYDMNDLYQNGWPDGRHNSDINDPWLHGDYKVVAYVYVYKVFDYIGKTKGEFNQ